MAASSSSEPDEELKSMALSYSAWYLTLNCSSRKVAIWAVSHRLRAYVRVRVRVMDVV